MVKNLPIGDPGSIPGSGRSPREGNGYPLQYSCLEISMDRGVWRARAYEVAESDITEVTNTFTFKSRFQRFSSQEGKIVTTWDDGYELILLCYHFAIYMYVLKRYAIYLKHIQCCMSIILIKLEKKKREKRKMIFWSSTSFLIKIFVKYELICPYLFRSTLRCVFPLMTLDTIVERKLIHSKYRVFVLNS